MNPDIWTLKPGYRKGPKGRHRRIKSPCGIEFVEQNKLAIFYHYCPSSNGFIALLLTIATGIIVQLVSMTTGFMVGPGFLIWWFLMNALRRKEDILFLKNATQIIADDRKNEIAILGEFFDSNRKSWVSLKCGSEYLNITAELEGNRDVQFKRGKLIHSDLIPFILLISLILGFALFILLMMSMA